MHYDVAIIGAGMSGLAAGIRLSYFGLRVCIVEKHYAFGGLNSYYKLDGREFDVGLHAVTNYVPEGIRSAPLPKLLRQLRLSRDDFDLLPQNFSEIKFPGRTLRFSNGVKMLTEEVSREFPRETDRFRQLTAKIQEFNDVDLAQPYVSARSVLRESLSDPVLIEMLLCPMMYYGSAQEDDMDFAQFVTMFKAIFLQGMARPRDGVRKIIKTLVRKYRKCGGEIKMQTGVQRIQVESSLVKSLVLENGEELSADIVLSSAGYHETMELCGEKIHNGPSERSVGQLSFVESIGVLNALPQSLGHDPTLVFFNDSDRFTYAKPDTPVDLRSGVICCPSNYEGHGDMPEGIFRATWLANCDHWLGYDDESYARQKAACRESFLACGSRFVPGFRDRVVYSDCFTPRTIRNYTGHINGAVYGMPQKTRDGRTHLENLFICGTDQGFLGIIGAMLSGVTIANMHVLAKM